ncbi:conserved membrane hypothetical protein [Bosea sp. 62]|uniref:DUF1499 domain-containing protein n=1 Tax=unclassified Bosea (in: a-proteobacteria) TaxID=2653178 RepID=UPI001250D302|nr:MULTISPECIES: DUF1499 domain-containing protein [unclassified Bosea (in: a-proteobacteria)]CAD5254026.1 conserved membrane hypothetical protein [Bosea sp. 7B]CAD5277148.1 conserved membrane hypothetical protein [Bosea sp. 21B]CAD5278244.1 conserved membrane hypothetical protein [Bosea sp. 46]VVT59801.1 conserved membrane hypothetical protein [Bosea sp. EC-HK365B]VXB43726.1 conserved membrane hypothetical protein [Bosea sp. 62]
MHRRLVFEEPISRAAIWSRRLALFGLTVVVLAVLIFRFGQPSVERLAPIAGAYIFVLLAFLLALAAFVRIWQDGHRGIGIAVQAFLLCLLLLAPVAYGGFQLATLPFLADVSTDVDEPPAFSRSRVALTAREGRVPPDVPAERRKAQRQGYPKAVPIVLELPAEIAYDIARKACVTLGWQVLEGAAPGGRSGAGRLDAVARSRVLRLVDDITIRIRPRADGSRIDIRSASRLGGFDFGANAKRIAAFEEEVKLLVELR